MRKVIRSRIDAMNRFCDFVEKLAEHNPQKMYENERHVPQKKKHLPS